MLLVMVTLALAGAINRPLPTKVVARTSINPASAMIGLTVITGTLIELGVKVTPSASKCPSPAAINAVSMRAISAFIAVARMVSFG